MEYTWIPEGVGVDRMLDEWARGQGRNGLQCIQLFGELRSVDLKAAPGKKVHSLAGPMYLTHGTYVRTEISKVVLGTISYMQGGRPSLVGGSLNRMVSGGLHAFAGAAPTLPARAALSDRPTMPEGMPALTASDIEDDEESPTLIPDDSLNERDLVHSTTEMPKLNALQTLSGGGGWGAAIEASGEADTPPPKAVQSDESKTPHDEATLKPGDILLHPRFGRCRVARVPMFGKVKVRRPTGALIDLHMKVLTFVRNPDEDGSRVYALKIGRK